MNHELKNIQTTTPSVETSWPSIEEVRKHYRARMLANEQLGKHLSASLQNPQLKPEVRKVIELWFEFYPECRTR